MDEKDRRDRRKRRSGESDITVLDPEQKVNAVEDFNTRRAAFLLGSI